MDGVVLEAAVDEVAEGGGVVGEVVLLEEVHKVLKVQLDSVVLEQSFHFHHFRCSPKTAGVLAILFPARCVVRAIVAKPISL